MASDNSLGHCGLFQGLCGLFEVFLLPRSGGVLAQKDGRTRPPPRDVQIGSDKENSPPAARELRFDHQQGYLLPVARNSPAVGGDLCSSSSQIRRMTWTRDVYDKDSPAVSRGLRCDYQEEDLPPAARNSPAQQRSVASGLEDDDDDDDDDCVILDSDPHSAVAVNGEEAGVGDGGSDDELQVVAAKGQVACRDFPHSRHLCSNMPFGTTSHEKHCTMCYCFVCDAPAPCSYWGNAISVDDHCHATDKETKWKALREAFRSNNLPASRPEEETVEHPTEMSLAHLFFSNQITLPEFMTRSRHMHASVRASRNVAPSTNAPSEGSSTSNGRSAQVNRPVEPTISAPRAHPAAGAGTTSNRTALITHPVESTVSAARPYSTARTGRGTSNTHISQITRAVEPTVSAARGYPVGRTGRGISNAHTTQITRPVEQTVSAPRVFPAARAGRDSSNAHSSQTTYSATVMPETDAPEGATVYVGNLPGHIDSEGLKLSFQQVGVVLFTKVIYHRETGRSRGFGYVTMSTAQEAETAVRTYNGSEVYGRPLIVNIAPPRGGARVRQMDTTYRQSGSPLKIFVCNLPRQVDRSRLEELFSEHGKVVNARVVYESREGACCSRGFGFVTMATEEESHTAIRALNKKVLEGRTLVVQVATERPQQGQNAASQSRNTHTSGRASPNVAPSVSAPRSYPATRARSATSYTAQVTPQADPTRSN